MPIHKIDYLNEMEKFLKRQTTQTEIILIRLVVLKIEFVIKTFPQRKLQAHMALTVNFTTYLRKN